MAWTFSIDYSFRTSSYCWRLVPALFFWTTDPTSSETLAYPACAFGAPHSFNHLLACDCSHSPKRGRLWIVRSRSCNEPNSVRSRILRTIGSSSRSPLRRMIYRSGELTFRCKSSILLLSSVMRSCFTCASLGHMMKMFWANCMSSAGGSWSGHSFLACFNLRKELQIWFYTTYDIPFRPSNALRFKVQGACPRRQLRSPRTCIITISSR